MLARLRAAGPTRPGGLARLHSSVASHPGLLTRLRAAVPSHRISWFVHVGNSLAVIASVSDEMVQLRSCMIGATTCGVCYNLLQPTPLWTPTYWGCFFITAHAVQIMRILRERGDVRMTDREHSLYERCFLPHGFTPRQFQSLIRDADATWVRIPAGGAVAAKGEEIRSLHLVTGGTGGCEVYDGPAPNAADPATAHHLRRHVSAADGVIAHVGQDSIGAGFWVGDCWDPNDEAAGHPERHRWPSSVRAVDGHLEAVRFDATKFREACREWPAAERMQIEALRAHREHFGAYTLRYQRRQKTRMRAREEAHCRQLAVTTYEAMVALAVSDGVVSPEEARTCATFRATHDNIGEVEHQEALRKAGWLGRPF